MQTTIRALLVEDHSDQADVIKSLLGGMEKLHPKVMWADSVQTAIRLLSVCQFDVVLLGLWRIELDTLRPLQLIREKNAAVPIVTFDDSADPSFARDCLANGAQHHLARNGISADALARSITYAMRRQFLMQQLSSTRSLVDAELKQLQEIHDDMHECTSELEQDPRVPLTDIRQNLFDFDRRLANRVTDERRALFTVLVDDSNASTSERQGEDQAITENVAPPYRHQCTASFILDSLQPILQRLSEESGIEYKTSIWQRLPNVFCDPYSVCSALSQIVEKAFKLSQKSSLVHISFREDFESDSIVAGVTCQTNPINISLARSVLHNIAATDPPPSLADESPLAWPPEVEHLIDLNLGCIRQKGDDQGRLTYLITLPVAEISEVASRYLQRLRRCDQPEVGVLLAEGECPDADDAAGRNLQKVLRRDDLMYPLNDGQRLIFTPHHADALDRYRARAACIDSQLEESSRESELPPIAWHEIGSWSTSVGCATILSSVREFCQRRMAASRLCLVTEDE